MAQLLTAGMLALAFAVLYVYGTIEAIQVAAKCGDLAAKGTPCDKSVTDIPNLSFLLNTFGNLISGGVVGVLAVTKRNELPAADVFNGTGKSNASTVASYIPISFIIVWILCGVAMVVWGFVKYPDVVPPLTAQAKAWLGSAAAALLAYLVPPPK